MVKGISKQVIVVHAPEEKLFEQAIFILNDRAVGCEGITDDTLLKEARRIMQCKGQRKGHAAACRALWVAAGALLVASAWLITVLL